MDTPDDQMIEELFARLLSEGTDDYLSRGRRFQALGVPFLHDLWITAFRDVFTNDRNDRIPDMDDLTVEMSLRHVDLPLEEVAAEVALIVGQINEMGPKLSSPRTRDAGGERAGSGRGGFEKERMFDLRFRSVVRNRETDERRLALIQKAVRSVVADAEAEATGLRTRVAKVRRSAISLVEQGDSGDHDPNRLAKPTSLEQQLLAAEQRLAQLKDHLAFLRTIEVAATRLPH
jgi:hypothetical protein